MNKIQASPARRKPARGPRRITAEYLERAGLYYLERYATSVENFRRVLMRKVLRSAQAHDDDPATGAALVDALVARYADAGLLDDRRYAEAQARALFGRGLAVRAIGARLRAKGVAADDIEAALGTLGQEERVATRDALDLKAACVFARKRRLGPYRKKADGREQRNKELAAMGRAGFGYEISRKVVEAGDVAALLADTGGD